MTTLVIDCEVHCTGDDPGWWKKDNKLTLFGLLIADTGNIVQLSSIDSLYAMPISCTVIGHNLAFDLGWMMREYGGSFFKWFSSPEVNIWDTMLIEYILNAQNVTGLSMGLKETAVRLGLVSEDWGLESFDVSDTELREYNKKDLLATKDLYEHQLRTITRDQIPFIASQMRMQKSTIMASLRGIYFDTVRADRERNLLELEYNTLRGTLEHSMGISVGKDCNPESSQDVGVFLFGGEVSKRVDVEVVDDAGNPVLIKSGVNKGKVKTKKQDITWHHPGVYPSFPHKEKTETGKWKVNEEVLKAVDIPFTRDILRLRDLKKQYTTYYESLIKYSDSVTGRIHPQYNHCVTVTGRLSSSKPNLQNIRGEG